MAAYGTRRVFKRRRFTKAVKKAIGYKPEYSYLDYVNGSVISAAGDVICINQISQGTTTAQRIGNSVMCQYIDITAKMMAPTGTNNFDWFRVSLVYDKCPNGTTPAYNVIFNVPGASYEAAMKNISGNADRFHICCSEEGYVADGSPVVNHLVKLKFKPKEYVAKCMYNSTGAATPNSGGYYVCFASYRNTGVAATAAAYELAARFAWYEF